MSFTVRDYQATPDGPPWSELIEGDLVQDPSPRDPHQSAAGEIYFAIKLYLRQHPIALVRYAPLDVYLDDINVFQPDVLVLLQDRASLRTDEGIKGAPDLVVEILSPSTLRTDLLRKRVVYARSGVREMWIVDTVAQTIAAFRFSEKRDAPVAIWLNAADDAARTPLLPGLSIPLRNVFTLA